MTVGELLERVSSAEMTRWVAYEHAFGPLGPTRGDLRAAQVAATVVNMLRDPRRRPVTVQDMRLRWPGDEPPRMDPQDQAVLVRQMAAALGGVVTVGDPG